MAVIKLVLAYDGTDFRGWARQPGQRTVEGVLEEALGRMLGAPPKLSAAGRTDAGVHAEAQVASFEPHKDVDPPRVQRALNGMLAPEVVVREARPMPDSFDARRSATGREYMYRILTDPVPDPFIARFTWHRPDDLDVQAMRRAASLLVGTHDFRSFCRVPKDGSSTVRTLDRLTVAVVGRRLAIRAAAPSFLHQMVRSLVGTLVAVGEGKVDAARMPEILDSRDRAPAGPIAPPHGLALARVRYGRRSFRGSSRAHHG